MSESLKQIEALIKNASLEANLTAEAFKHFSALTIEVKELEAKHQELSDNYDELLEQHTDLLGRTRDIDLREIELNKATNEARALKAQLSHELDILELKEKFTQERVQDHKEMMRTIFANTQVKRSIMENRTSSTPAHYSESGNWVDNQSNTESNSIDETIIEE